MIATFLGVALLIIVGVDLLWTTLWNNGAAGPITSQASTLVWRGLRALGGPRSTLFSLAGPVVLVATLTVWIAGLWLGWTLVFSGDPTVLVDTRDAGPISWMERQYFVAYSMFTMGNGDFAPVDGWPQIATSLTTASGMLAVTLSVSYILSVLSAVNQQRAFAGSVQGLGARAEDIVVTGWDGVSLHSLDLPLNSLHSQLSLLAAQHRAYPVLHHYHSNEPQSAAPLAVAVLDETLTLLEVGVAPENGANRAIVAATRSSVEDYLKTLGSASIHAADEAPPAPDLARLESAGIPARPEEEVLEAIARLGDRRRMLLGIVRADAWAWPGPQRSGRV